MKKRVIKKLSLNKTTITTMKTDMMENAKGGVSYTQIATLAKATCDERVCLILSYDPMIFCSN